MKSFFSSIFSSGDHFVQPSRTILVQLVESHQRNISVKLFKQEGPEALNRSPEYTGPKSNI